MSVSYTALFSRQKYKAPYKDSRGAAPRKNIVFCYLASAYSHEELGEKDLRFGGVPVFCNGVAISLLDKSVCNQAIDSLPFPCIQIFGSFYAPSGQDIAKDRQFFVGDGDGFCHLTRSILSSRP